jgi:XTP/dITP diphosphohydrolase
MAQKLLIGSNNHDKALELRVLLKNSSWQVVSLNELPHVAPPPEDGLTFQANALKKARYYGTHFKLACVADDSGLEVDALDGAPGVFSARYAGEVANYSDNNQKLLDALAGVAPDDRTARFVCCAALVTPAGAMNVEIGTVEGRIADAPRGDQGFGYDPIFIPQGHTRTFGEMRAEEKHALSHRGRAFQKMRQYLASCIEHR